MQEVKNRRQIRRCVICDMPLSKFNRANVCFHHPEHPDHRILGIPHSHKVPIGAGHDTPGIDQMDREYSGGEIDWE